MRLPRVNNTFCAYKVSIHAPTRGATILFAPIRRSRGFQSTHPHGVRQCVTYYLTHSKNVSIHAPTRGATLLHANTRKPCTVSIHAPTRGATYSKINHLAISWFQSTHPHGVRLLFILLPDYAAHVSIHAPTRGATRLYFFSNMNISRFNPRTHTGCDLSCSTGLMPYFSFQSTHPHGVRHRVGVFNHTSTPVSIHAPTRGATL